MNENIEIKILDDGVNITLCAYKHFSNVDMPSTIFQSFPHS